MQQIHYPSFRLPDVAAEPENPAPGTALVPQEMRSASIDLSCHLPHGELVKLYRSVEASLRDLPNRVVQFVSAYPDEGASKIAFETAIIAARLMGRRVLFIDTAAAQVDRLRDTPNANTTPLDTLLLSGLSPYEGITQAAGTTLHFARLRERGEDGFAAASLHAIEGALEKLRAMFDLIIIDSPAILTDAFSMALAKLADGSVLVIEADRTRLPVALESKRLVEAGGGRMLGSILNRRRYYIPRFLYRYLYAHAYP